MRFQLPQFIEHEPKVIGPLTFRQFLYIGVSAAMIFFLYFLRIPFTLFVMLALTLGLVGFALAFVKMGGRSLPSVLMNLLSFSFSPKTYIWKLEKSTSRVKSETASKIKNLQVETKK